MAEDRIVGGRGPLEMVLSSPMQNRVSGSRLLRAVSFRF